MTTLSTKPRRSGRSSGSAKEPVAQRRARLLDDIARERNRMFLAAQTIARPLHRVDAMKASVRGSRQWLYPAAPLIALLAFRFRPRVTAVPRLLLRGWSVWRLVRRFR